MYVKVHKEGNHWVRDDNGTLLGEDCFGETFADYPYVKIKDKKVPVAKGCLDENGFFIPFCTVNPKHCEFGCMLRHLLRKPHIVCPLKYSNNLTCGYYAKVPHYLTLT